MKYTLSEEMTMVRDTVRDFVTNELVPLERELVTVDAGPLERRGAPISAENQTRLKRLAIDQGLWAMTTPEAMGGGGLSALGASLVAEELGKTWVEFDFGDVPAPLFDASPEQKANYLAPMIAGEKECAVAWREPKAGQIQTRAVRENGQWRLDGTKLSKPADAHLVFARCEQGLSCFIVSGLPVLDGRLTLKDVGVPSSGVLGEIGKAAELGAAYRPAEIVRAAARCVGVGSRLLEMGRQYARDWKVFGQPLAVRPAVQTGLAEMCAELEAARGMIYRAAEDIDNGVGDSTDAVKAHYFAAGMAQRALDRTVSIYGGPSNDCESPFSAMRERLSPAAFGEIRRVEAGQIAEDLLKG